MPRYGFRYGTDDGDMGCGYRSYEFPAANDTSARRSFGQRVRHLRAAATEPDGIVLWGTIELFHLYRDGRTELLETRNV